MWISGWERGCFSSVNVSVCVIVLIVRFAFSFALESQRKGKLEEGKREGVKPVKSSYFSAHLLQSYLRKTENITECEKRKKTAASRDWDITWIVWYDEALVQLATPGMKRLEKVVRSWWASLVLHLYFSLLLLLSHFVWHVKCVHTFARMWQIV